MYIVHLHILVNEFPKTVNQHLNTLIHWLHPLRNPLYDIFWKGISQK